MERITNPPAGGLLEVLTLPSPSIAHLTANGRPADDGDFALNTPTQTTLLTRGNIGYTGVFLFKVLGTPLLAFGLLLTPYAWVAGWLPTTSPTPLKLLALVGDDYERVGPVYASTPSDPNEQHLD